MDINLNDELMNAGKEVEDTFGAFQRAVGKYEYLQTIVRQMAETKVEPEVQNDLKN